MKLVDANVVRELLTENIDAHVSQYVVFTDHGTLLSHSQPSPLRKRSLIKFTPFAGAIWRNHNAQVAATGNTHLNIGGLPGMKTLDFVLKQDSTGLLQLTLEMEGLVSVIREVVPRLLVAAQSEIGESRGEVDEVTGRIEGLELDSKDPDEASSTSVDDQEEEVEETEVNASATSQGSESELRSSNQVLQSGETTTKRPGKLRILELKAEGMAESLTNDYPTRLPHDFY